MSELETTLVVVGTGTEVGKTWASCRLLERARASGIRVSARKPAQSFEGTGPTDAELLGAASAETPEQVCPVHRSYTVPMAPPMAAEVLHRLPITLEELVSELRWKAGSQLRLLETAGGLRSPIAHDGDNLDLLRRIRPTHVLLIADAGLGTINSVRLCMSHLVSVQTTVLLNRFATDNDLHERNREWLAVRDGFDVVIDACDLIDRLVLSR
jgi:dethiobiotin synthetase